jgi:NAD(P)-dependent dehydrogenase (short-subunit alcohol dehydrogenase family)/acyl carrier protein
MDAAERQFGITIEMEDFIDVRTVQDIARRISGISARQGGPKPQPGTSAVHPAALPGQGLAAPGAPPVGADLLEGLIRIIMEATGFERDEIQPDMDLRRDLSIRSSRLPIIMDAAERQFGITIEMEDFIGARTVLDIARRISGIIASPESASLPLEAKGAVPGPEREENRWCTGAEASVKRVVFNPVPVAAAVSIPLELRSGDSVLLLSLGKEDGLDRSVKEILRREYGVDPWSLRFMPGDFAPGEAGYEPLTDAGSARTAERIASRADLAGMVITLPQGGSGGLSSMAEVARLLTGLLLPLQAFLRSPKKKFMVLVHAGEENDTPGQLLAEGVLGLFLSAAQEYPSVLFRTLAIERDTDLRVALRGALDRGCPAVEFRHRDGRVFTAEGRVAPAVCGNSPSLQLGPGDVVVFSGGATGISAALARSLVPCLPRLVFLGRTVLPPGADLTLPQSGYASDDTCAADPRAAEIARTLAELHAAGSEATYHTCDVTDPAAVRSILGEVVGRYGRIDGIIHGAGVLRDSLLSLMAPEDFSLVTEVKFLGAWNLFAAAQGAGLRFFVGLSSAAAIQGNPGQANYAAGNRMMSALLGVLQRENQAIRCKALQLPPVEGAGMAEDPEIRELLQRKGVGYIHANELAGLFCRELLATPAEDVWVMFMRQLPAVKTAPLMDATRPSLPGELAGGTLSLRPEDFPMIESISRLDLRREELEAGRTFSRDTDLWIADHRPFKFIQHPLVSAAMVVETFMEAARVLFPHLQVRGVRQVRLLEMIQCPPGIPRPSRISCRRVEGGLQEVLCEVCLAAPEITPAGRLTDRFIPHFQGQVLLAGGDVSPGSGLPGFPVRPDELRTRPLEQKNILKWYQDHSGLEGRYRVLERLDGAGPGAVRGRTTCRETGDFGHLQNARYQYSPYLFEALLQVVGFHLAATAPAERRSMIPLEIGEMRFLRKCRAGEPLILEARLRGQDEAGRIWDARAVDAQGDAIMQIQSLRMQWVAD